LIETIFPIACYKVRGSFLSAGDSFANGDELVLADATNGDKKFIVIHQRVIEGNTEFLLSSINGGELNINATLTSNAKQFKVLSFDEPEIDKRSGDILVMSGYTNFSQNESRVSTIRTILSFAECVDSGV
jgi:hypothetical protein